MENMTDMDRFRMIDLRAGTILTAEPLAGARQPAFVLKIDFGELGVLKTSAQLTANYSAEGLAGRQIIAVVNLPEKQIGGVMSKCLVLGVNDDKGGVVLLSTDTAVKNGRRVY
jgi:tRNA-binding protein